MSPTHPLSVGQTSLWLLYKLAPGSAAYNVSGAVRFHSAPDEHALRVAVDAVVARHELLRSAFTEADGRPVRVPLPPGESVLDVRSSAGADDDELSELVLAASRQPYDLTGGGPFRAVLFRRADDAVLLLGLHHIASDATSQWTLWRDLLAAYDAEVGGRAPNWPALTSSYDDHVELERRLLDSPRGARMDRYWAGVRADARPAQLPADHSHRAHDGATCALRLPEDLVARLRVAAKAAGASPFAYLLGAFQALIHRYTRQTDFTIVCPASTRRAAMRDVVGYFVNALVLRARFAPGASFADAVASAGEQIRGGMAQAAYPYALTGQARAARQQDNHRIAITMVSTERIDATMQRLVDEEIVCGGVRMSRFDIAHLEGQCDLSVEITQGTRSLTVEFRYDTGLFERATVRQLLDRYLRMIEIAVSTPDAQIATTSLVDGAERARLLSIGGVR